MESLGVNKPDVQPKATDHINEMIEMIESLVEKNVAYVVDQHVLFNVSKYKHYGKLSRRTKEQQIAEADEVAGYKKNPEDFILWKPSKKNEPSWDSHEKVDLDGYLSVVRNVRKMFRNTF